MQQTEFLLLGCIKIAVTSYRSLVERERGVVLISASFSCEPKNRAPCHLQAYSHSTKGSMHMLAFAKSSSSDFRLCHLVEEMHTFSQDYACLFTTMIAVLGQGGARETMNTMVGISLHTMSYSR